MSVQSRVEVSLCQLSYRLQVLQAAKPVNLALIFGTPKTRGPCHGAEQKQIFLDRHHRIHHGETDLGRRRQQDHAVSRVSRAVRCKISLRNQSRPSPQQQPRGASWRARMKVRGALALQTGWDGWFSLRSSS